jgi:hypothetical protein
VAARQQSAQGFIYYRFLAKDDPTGPCRTLALHSTATSTSAINYL